MQILIPKADEVNFVIDEEHEHITIAINSNEDVLSIEINNVKFTKVHYVPFEP